MEIDNFELWWSEHGQHWAAKREAEGGTPWTTDMDERRATWDRRYQRPAPPDLPAIVSIADYNRRANAA